MDTRIIHLLARKLSGEATAEELAELDQLLTRSPESVYYAELIMQLWDEEKMRRATDTDINYLRHISRHRPVFNQKPAVPPNAEPETAAVQPRRVRRRQLMGILAILFIPAALYYGGRGLFYHRSAPGGPKYIACYVGPGSRNTVILPDGTKVRLNAGSTLRYDSDMLRKDRREVMLSGEAYFDVEKDKQRCFIIHTDKIAIRVLGTAFNVKAYPREKVTETTLMNGSIELTVNSKPYQMIILKPREKFALIDDQPDHGSQAGRKDTLTDRHGQAEQASNKEKLIIQDVVPVEVADKQYVREVSWVEDNFVFQNETLEELAPRMERWFNVQISIDNQRIRGLHFTGIFHKETISQALQAMQFIKPFKFKISENHVFID